MYINEKTIVDNGTLSVLKVCLGSSEICPRHHLIFLNDLSISFSKSSSDTSSLYSQSCLPHKNLFLFNGDCNFGKCPISDGVKRQNKKKNSKKKKQTNNKNPTRDKWQLRYSK